MHCPPQGLAAQRVCLHRPSNGKERRNTMRLRIFLGLAALTAALAIAAPTAPAQVSVAIGAAPVCPYGHYDFAPSGCAPYGYYGPELFPGGVFVGAGPWFPGPHGFYGLVDNRFDPHHGYARP